MVLEIVVGTAVSWLWGRLSDVAEAKDNEKGIYKALHESIGESFRQFQEKYGDKSALFFNKEFIENSACPEILKFLTRNENPDLDAVGKALPVAVLFSSESGFKEEIKVFFDMIMDAMKSHDVLQEIINNRQIEETNQRVKDIHEDQRAHSKILNEGLERIAFQQEEVSRDAKRILSQGTESQQKIDKLLILFDDSLPSSKGNELNKLLAKQLDKARDFINNDQVNDGKILLDSIEEEVKGADDYTRFRWHTNQGACLLSNDQRQEAVEQYLIAYNFAKNEEKAIANKIRAYLLMGDFERALKESETAIQVFSQSGIIWALHINANNSLNIEFEQSALPAELQNDKFVLLILSDIKIREKAFEESYSLAMSAFQQDKKSSDAKRALLASALSWATADTVKSQYKQLTKEQHQALKTAVDSYGDVLAFLKSIQSKHIFTEIAHNLAVASELIGNVQLKNEITTYAFSMHPDEELFIWHKVKELKTSGDIDSIRKLTDEKLNALEKPLLFAIAEAGANAGDTEWVKSVSQVLKTKDLDKHERDELFGLELCVIWKGGSKSDAIRLAKANLARISSYPSLLSFYIRMLNEYGEFEERDKLLKSCKNLREDASSVDIIQIADLLYDFGLYFDASSLYKKLIESPSDDYLTKRYLDSLIKSDQRAKASAALEQLSPVIRNTSSFKRIEANLARASGDLDKLEQILSEELESHPSDSFVAAGYIATLFRKNKLGELNKYLNTNPVFDPIIEQNEIEIAKYEMELGRQNEALLRTYKLFRAKPGDSELAGHYFLLMLLVKDLHIFKGLNEVSTGAVVYLQAEGESKKIVIEPASLQGNGWPQCISENTKLARILLGKKIGEEVYVDGGIGSKQYKISNIDSMFIFASNIAQDVVASSASSAGPLWSVNVQKSNGEFDFSPLLESLKQRSKRVENVFSVYEEQKFPLQMLSNALGIDVVTLVSDTFLQQSQLVIAIVHIIQRCHFGKQLKQRRFLERRHAQDL